jgi:hypothetical protein
MTDPIRTQEILAGGERGGGENTRHQIEKE